MHPAPPHATTLTPSPPYSAASASASPSSSSSTELPRPIPSLHSANASSRSLTTRLPCWYAAAITWVRGPQPSVPVDFHPLFPWVQAWPALTVQRVLKTRASKVVALVAFWLVWFVLFVVVVHYSRFADRVDGVTPWHLSCSASLWSRNDGCGLNGRACEPFVNNTFTFRCPASCISSGQVLNPRAVGAQIALYQPFVVGGQNLYRADSFLCPSAIHAGLISDRLGGCGVVSQIGSASGYPSQSANGISSLGFDAAFPSSYEFVRPSSVTGCADLRWHLFAVSIPFTVLISLLAPQSPAVFFFSVFTGVFFHVALASDPPALTDANALVSTALSRFLPLTFAAWAVYAYVIAPVHSRAVFTSGRGALERTLLFLLGLWVGALENFTFETWIPINRLTPHDLEQQPGAKAALVVIVLLLLAAAVWQVKYLRLTGQLPQLLLLYAGVGIALGLLAAIPGQELRIHHYIIGLLLLPGTRVPTRMSLLYQGLLVGLLINGIARWGWDGIVQTSTELLGDSLLGSDLPVFAGAPNVTASVDGGAGNVSIFWDPPPAGEGWSGIEVLVNDVERYVWVAEGSSGDASSASDDTDSSSSSSSGAVRKRADLWKRVATNVTATATNGATVGNGTSSNKTTSRTGGEYSYPWKRGQKLYFRLGYYGESGSGDFTEAGVVDGDGRWKQPGGGST